MTLTSWSARYAHHVKLFGPSAEELDWHSVSCNGTLAMRGCFGYEQMAIHGEGDTNTRGFMIKASFQLREILAASNDGQQRFAS